MKETLFPYLSFEKTDNSLVLDFVVTNSLAINSYDLYFLKASALTQNGLHTYTVHYEARHNNVWPTKIELLAFFP